MRFPTCFAGMLWEHSRAAGSTVPVDRRKQPSEVRVGNAARRDADVAGGVGELANVHLAGPPELRSITIHSSHRALFVVCCSWGGAGCRRDVPPLARNVRTHLIYVPGGRSVKRITDTGGMPRTWPEPSVS
jgi:hypothetical protein